MSDSAGNSKKKVVGRPFPKGKSGNPNGRPHGAAGLSAYIKGQTRDCEELADLLLEIARGDKLRTEYVGKDATPVEMKPDFHVRVAAIKELKGRAVGSIQTKLELTGKDGGPLELAMNLAGATDEELEDLERIGESIASRQRGDAGGSQGGEGETGGGSQS
jgi:hypothetical protein